MYFFSIKSAICLTWCSLIRQQRSDHENGARIDTPFNLYIVLILFGIKYLTKENNLIRMAVITFRPLVLQ